jgi:hypothetical protein
MCREGLEKRSPAGREFGEANDLDRTEDGRRMADAVGRGGDNVYGTHHAGRELVEDGRF